MDIKVTPESKTEVIGTQLEVSVKPEVTVKSEITATPKAVKTEQVKNVENTFQDKVPANWSIKPTEEGIEARSNSTGEHFTGTIAEFNQKLRG